LTSAGVPEMVANKYPTFAEAVRALTKASSVAFSSNFALMGDPVIPSLVFVYHKGAKVGYYSQNTVFLGPKFTCLRETLTELGVKVGTL
jgi:hypothetical protein